MTHRRKALTVGAGAAALALGLTGCSVSTGPDEIAVKYDASPVTSTTSPPASSP